MKGLKRIHLFEFEDFSWFPHWLRNCMTNYLLVMHRILNTEPEIAKILKPILAKSNNSKIVDLCSGSGGPMPNVKRILENEFELGRVDLHLTDLYPNLTASESFKSVSDISYHTESVDATSVGSENNGIRTMICSLHHMRPTVARNILADAQKSEQPFLAFEISDNSFPKWLWWTSIPVAFLMVFVFTPLVKPTSWQQIVFTYVIPILPLLIAWDGAVSNARTYTVNDLDILISDLPKSNYRWEKKVIKGNSKLLYLLGTPEEAT